MIRIILSFAFVFGFNLLFAQQKTYTINTIDDLDDGVCNAQHCSLREAVIASNNDNISSKIVFNISGQAPFVIKLKVNNLESVLSDDIIIDGTTQPGYKPGVIQISGELLNPFRNEGVGFHIQDVEKCEIYGLYMHSFDYAAIVIEESINIKLGDIGKGNAISNNNSYGVLMLNSKNVQFKNNVIGLSPDGKKIEPNEVGLYIENTTNTLIGGGLDGQGNTISSNLIGLDIEESNDITIQGNKFGSDLLGIKRMVSDEEITGVIIKKSEDILIGGDSKNEGNFFAGNIAGDLQIYQCIAQKTIRVQGNFFDISYDLNTLFADTTIDNDIFFSINEGVAIKIVESENVLIGGKDNVGKNFFGVGSILIETLSKKVTILENSFICMGDYVQIDGTSNNEKQKPLIKYASPWEIIGESEPGDTVDIYSIGQCALFEDPFDDVSVEFEFGSDDWQFAFSSGTIDEKIASAVSDNFGNWHICFLEWTDEIGGGFSIFGPSGHENKLANSLYLIAISRDTAGNSSGFSDAYIGISRAKEVKVTTTEDLVPGSLRNALMIAGDVPSIKEVVFELSGKPPFIFGKSKHNYDLRFGDSVIVDATTQPNFRPGDIIIDGEGKEDSNFEISDNNYELYGLTFRNMTNGLIVSGDNNVIGGQGIKANNFINCKNAGILVTGINNVIQNNVIGAEINTLSMKPNGTGIIVNKVKTGITRIGGSEGWQSNQIIGNNSDGIKIMNSGDPSKSNSIIIEGNEIGIGFSGQTIKIRNGGNGVNIENSVNVLIGGTNPNIIAGNLGHGLLLNNSSANVYNNRIGYSGGLGNERNGVHIIGSSSVNVGNPKNTLGGRFANRIAYNGGYGIWRDNLQPQISHNEIYCNQRGGFFVDGAYTQETIAIIESSLHALKGSSNIPSGLLEIYKTSSECKNLPCQGGQLLSTVQTDSKGNWVLKNFGTPLLPNEAVSVCKAGSPTNFFGCTPVICPQFTNLKDILRKDTSICSSELTINTPLSNLEKIAWFASDNSIGISQSLINQWSIKNLKLGANTIFRSLSTAECGTYYRDTIKIFQYLPPSANNDSFNIQIKGKQPTTIDLLANDVLDTTNLEITLTNLPSWRSGNLIHKGKGRLEFQPQSIENESGTISYTICSGVCKKCASAQSYINIEAYDPEKLVFVPSGLTINGDGKNDQLIISGLDQFPKNRLRVFSRWGNLVYDKEDYANESPWTGRGKNEQFLPQGTYYYVLQLEGHSEIIKGTIHILTN